MSWSLRLPQKRSAPDEPCPYLPCAKRTLNLLRLPRLRSVSGNASGVWPSPTSDTLTQGLCASDEDRDALGDLRAHLGGPLLDTSAGDLQGAAPSLFDKAVYRFAH